MIEFTVPGSPVAKGRPRFSTRAGIARTYTPAKTARHERLVRQHAAAAFPAPLTGALRLEVLTYHAMPQRLTKAAKQAALLGALRPSTRPDADNMLKAVSDALNGVAYADDAQLVEVECRKFYALEPKTIVRVRQLEVV